MIYSLDDLRKIRQEYERREGVRKDETVRIKVVLSICSLSVGAGEILKAIQDTIRREHIKNVIVEITGCIGLCHAEPMIMVSTPGKPDAIYDLVTPDKARVITIAHGLYYKAVYPWMMNNK
ncbi:MAG: (2Fe-2S) ferredoxin domain-containing protein [Clostridiaceae bacterium]|nr:(2Fe-2S) ferredoxin domain-containing protein [Clostridiaceae bacterium]